MGLKIRNEVKVGAVALVTILAFIYLYNYLKGKDLFTSTASYYVLYNDIGGLTESNPVEISGFKAGVVQSIHLVNDGSGRIFVELSISKDYKLPTGSIAEITPASLIAGMKIRILFGQGPGFYTNRDTIPGKLAASLFELIENEFIPVKDKISNLISNLDSAITGINQILTPEFTKDLRGSMANLNNTTATVSDVLGSGEKDLKKIIADLSAFTSTISANSGRIDTAIGNFRTITDSLAAADIYGAISGLRMSLMETKKLLENINEGKGSAGQFVTNDSLYSNLTSSLASLDRLLTDLRENPKRYVHFSLFGRK